MHRQKVEVGANECEHKMELAQALVGHAARELGEPVINRCKYAHHSRPIDHIVEVTNDEIGIADMNIDGDCGKHNAGNA